MKYTGTIFLTLLLSYSVKCQITEENGIPTGMTIQNPSNSSNSYYTVDLTVNPSNGRAAGGISIGLDDDLFQRYWLYHSYYDNNQFVGKFFINYGAQKFFTIQSDGNIGIGTANPDSKLAVNGTIHTKEVKVDLNGWPDFVFENDYKLRTLEEVEKHIEENGHLPEIPSEAEVTENGINLGEMNAKLLQKIEELTLYMIEQNKQNQAQQEKIEQLERELKALKNK